MIGPHFIRAEMTNKRGQHFTSWLLFSWSRRWGIAIMRHNPRLAHEENP